MAGIRFPTPDSNESQLLSSDVFYASLAPRRSSGFVSRRAKFDSWKRLWGTHPV